MDGLYQELADLTRQWQTQEEQTLNQLLLLADLLEHRATDKNANDESMESAQLKSCMEALKGSGEEWKKLHSSVSKYGKSVDRQFKGDLVDICKPSTCSIAISSPSSTSAASAGDTCQPTRNMQQDQAISLAIMEHFYREGMFVAGDVLIRDLQQNPMSAEESCNDMSSSPNQQMTDDGNSNPVGSHLKDQFLEMHNLLQSLIRQRDIAPAVSWIERNADVLGSEGTRLAFQLHCLEFISRLRGTEGSDQTTCITSALDYAQKNLQKYYPLFVQDTEILMGALSFGSDLERSPYASLLVQDMWGDVEEALATAYCTVYGLSRESALQLVFNIGSSAWPRISRLLSMVRDRPGVEWNPSEELPVEVDVGRCNRFHTVFVCPVLRQQTTKENPPIMMACGHVISQEALTRLARGNVNYRVKCPYCPVETTPSQTLQVHF